MRGSLAESKAASPDVEVYPAGSIILCQSCLKPLYRLERGIGVGEKAGRSVDAFKPVQPADLLALREAIDPGVAGAAKAWTPEDMANHCAMIPDVRTGTPALCPCCGSSYVRVRAATGAELIDRAYVWELVTIPPGRALRGREARAWSR